MMPIYVCPSCGMQVLTLEDIEERVKHPEASIECSRCREVEAQPID